MEEIGETDQSARAGSTDTATKDAATETLSKLAAADSNPPPAPGRPDPARLPQAAPDSPYPFPPGGMPGQSPASEVAGRQYGAADAQHPAPATDMAPPADHAEDLRPALTALVVCDKWGSEKGGIPVFNMKLCEGLADAGVRVYCVIGHPVTGLSAPDNVTLIGPQSYDPKVDERYQLKPDPRQLPGHVDLVAGHGRFSGEGAENLRDSYYPETHLVHFIHTVPGALGQVQGRPETGIKNEGPEQSRIARADLAAGVGPVLTAEARRLGGNEPGAPAYHEFIPGVVLVKPDQPIEDRPRNILIIGRVDDPQKGVEETARMVQAIRDYISPDLLIEDAEERLEDPQTPLEEIPENVLGEIRNHSTTLEEMASQAPAQDVSRDLQHLRDLDREANIQLIVRGAKGNLADVEERLSLIIDHKVDVRPFTTDPADILADHQDAVVVIMPGAAEGFGLTALEAAGAWVPVLVPDSSGFGAFISDASRFPTGVTHNFTVPQPFEGPIQVSGFADSLQRNLRDLPRTANWAAELAQWLGSQDFTWKSAAQSLLSAVSALPPRPGTPPTSAPPGDAPHGDTS
jgi:hypothetical protein